MSIKISLQNEGGELDSRTVKTEAEIRDALIELIESVPLYYSGDKIIITDDEE